jgi:cysteinyl-tRNA synthetase
VRGARAAAAGRRRGAAQAVTNWLADRTKYGVWLSGSDPAVIAASAYDLMTVDPDEQTTAEIAQMQAMPGGQRRYLIAYLSVGEAGTYRSYWDPAWSTTPPSWLGPENPDWPGDYRVRYWETAWQNMLFRDGASSHLGQILAKGFDGVFYDVVDTYQYWENQGRASAANEMVSMLADMYAYAKSVNPNFKVVAQNADDLLLRSDYLAAIDAVSKESLWYYEGVAWTGVDRQWLDQRAGAARAAGKPILSIEYLTDQAQIDDAFARSTAAGDLLYIGPVSLNALWTRVPTQSTANWLAAVADFGVWLTGSDPAAVAATGYDMVVVDPDEQTAQDVADMRAMPGGGSRRLVAYLSVSEAVDYRWYWQTAWNTAPPSWLGVQNGPGWYRVQYWTQDWKNLLYANGATSSIGRILAAGFDGVYLTGVDAYETWAGEGRATAEAEMVSLVAALSTYAKSVNPNFKVIPANADALLMRSDYLSSIDGALRAAVRYDEAGTPRTQGDLDWILPKLANAKAAGKKILTVEFTDDQAEINAAYAANEPLGYLTYAAPAALDALWTRVPTQAAANWLNDRTRYGVWLTMSDPAVIAASPYDLMTVDPDEQTASEMTQMQAMAGGGRRRLLAYLSVGEAVNYRWYWQAAWNTTPPSWLGTENPSWPGAYRVQYWNMEWQNLLFRNGASSSLGRILAAGFDGVFYDVVDTYVHWQEGGRATAADEMVDMLADMHAYAKSVNPDFKIVAQNADDLLLRSDYLAAIDGVSKESLWFNEGVAWTAGDRAWLDPRANNARANGRRIFTIEYITDQAQINQAFANSNAAGDLLYIAPHALDVLWTRVAT